MDGGLEGLVGADRGAREEEGTEGLSDGVVMKSLTVDFHKDCRRNNSSTSSSDEMATMSWSESRYDRWKGGESEKSDAM